MTVQEAHLYVHTLANTVTAHRDVEVVVAPGFLSLEALSVQTPRSVRLAAQHFHWADQGPYTGEVSASQLAGLVEYGLVGHSERRHLCHETDRQIRAKIRAALRHGFRPILCVGETATERAAGQTEAVLIDQLAGGLAGMDDSALPERLIIAYEPVWAIGTASAAIPDEVAGALAVVRRWCQRAYGRAGAAIPLLYGGSVTVDNAAGYLALDGVGGLLLGGTGLDARAVATIADIAHQPTRKKLTHTGGGL